MDLRIALRRLAKNPAFFATACVTLALAIGANTAAFSLVQAILLHELPVRDPSSLALVSTKYTQAQYSMSYPAYVSLRDRSASLDGVIAFRAQPLNVSTGGTTERVTGMLVSGNYFDVLGVGMTAGSPIQAKDDLVPASGGGRGLVAVLSHQYWRRHFNGSAAVVGASIRINGHPFTVVGVAPPRFHGTRVGSLPDVFVPMMFAAQVFDWPGWLSNPRNNWLRIIARVKPATSLAQSQAEMTAVFRRFSQDAILPLANDDTARRRARESQIVLEPGRTGLMEMGNATRPTLFALLGLVALVLVIACVNVSTLMVGRAERLHRETAISMALGATRLRVWRQSLLESLVISAAGVTLGLLVALVMRGFLLQLVPARQELDVTMNGRVFGAAVLLGCLTTIVMASLTARQGLGARVFRALKAGDVGSRLRLRKGLIVAQLALSVVVLAAAALFVQTLNQMLRVDPGFAREGVLIASTATDGFSPAQRDSFDARLLDEVQAIPGVVSAALANDEPLGVRTEWNIIARRDPAGPPQQATTSVAFISPGYFKTMGIALVRGRDFEDRDVASAGPVIVNERFVTSYLPAGQNPVGASVVGNGNMTFHIIGVVKDSLSTGLRDLDRSALYVPGGRGVLHVRTAARPASLAGAVRAAVHRVDPDVPVYSVHTIGEQIDRSMRSERTFAMLASAFAVLALMLAAVGLYGLLANAVGRRGGELAVRLALGASPRQIVRLVLGEAGLLVALGAVTGLAGAMLTARAIRSLPFGVQPADWTSLTVALGGLMIVAALSTWIPAHRASRVDPVVALRSE